MSLATYASEFNTNENINPIQKKRENMKNRTLKRRESNKTNPKIEAMVRKIHDDEEDTDLTEFQPLGPPSSAGMERIDAQGMEEGLEERLDVQQNPPLSYENQQAKMNVQENFSQLPSEYAKQYYQQYVPYFNQMSDDLTPNGANKDELLTKLNQIIYLLEEQQDEKTGHVTEELILYSFLGVFIIFIVDSFARVGKYVR
jgi:hypothetical protein|uniref:Uncharacterized protein n=1 Tax=viral metagenome TaxID=1070528 RepID=A0A6C0CKC0_9ZZZZ